MSTNELCHSESVPFLSIYGINFQNKLSGPPRLPRNPFNLCLYHLSRNIIYPVFNCQMWVCVVCLRNVSRCKSDRINLSRFRFNFPYVLTLHIIRGEMIYFHSDRERKERQRERERARNKELVSKRKGERDREREGTSTDMCQHEWESAGKMVV